MKLFLSVILLGSALSAAGAQAATCLNVSQIKSTDAPNSKSLTITMKNGVVWQSQFPRPCTGIQFSGFRWDVRGDMVCENAQTLRVIDTGMLCSLGKLTQVAAKK